MFHAGAGPVEIMSQFVAGGRLARMPVRHGLPDHSVGHRDGEIAVDNHDWLRDCVKQFLQTLQVLTRDVAAAGLVDLLAIDFFIRQLPKLIPQCIKSLSFRGEFTFKFQYLCFKNA
jgi:hypothetical protein